jgi:hypothetical protein
MERLRSVTGVHTAQGGRRIEGTFSFMHTTSSCRVVYVWSCLLVCRIASPSLAALKADIWMDVGLDVGLELA